MKTAALCLFLSAGCLLAQTNAISTHERLKWIVSGTVGPQSLATGLVSAGVSTGKNSPEEYGPHWEGFGKRYGIRLSGIGVNRTIEGGLGAIWGEDPRYRRLGAGEPGKERLLHVLRWTFLSARQDGTARPAYARYMAWGGGSFLSSTWRPDSDADVKAGVERVYLGVLLRMAGNALSEFGPDLRHRHAAPSVPPRTPPHP